MEFCGGLKGHKLDICPWGERGEGGAVWMDWVGVRAESDV